MSNFAETPVDLMAYESETSSGSSVELAARDAEAQEESLVAEEREGELTARERELAQREAALAAREAELAASARRIQAGEESASAAERPCGSDGPSGGPEKLSLAMLADPPEMLSRNYLYATAQSAAGSSITDVERATSRTARMPMRPGLESDTSSRTSRRTDRSAQRSKRSGPKSQAQLAKERKAKVIIVIGFALLNAAILAGVVIYALRILEG